MTPSSLLLVSAIVSSSCFFFVDAFVFHHEGNCRGSCVRLFSATGTLVSLERETEREVGQLQDWAGQCGVQAENGFYLDCQMVDNIDDWYAVTGTGVQRGSRVLYVPGEMIMSASQIAQEYDGYATASFQLLADMGMQHLFKHFYLFLKVMVEYEQGSSSPYFPWFQALPRKWNTAASMDSFCLSCLPPFLKSLCQIEQDQLEAFSQALNVFDYVSPESKANPELMKFAYNIVFTRSWRSEEGDYRIVPVADMINHGYPDNVVISYDEYGGCEVTAKEDLPPGSPLTLSYGQPTNPSRFLATYGFINESPSFFCKMLLANPSQELRDLGYDPNRMLFYADGSVSPEVWDVLLYSRLEKKAEMADIKNTFYQAHMSGDEQTKQAIHAQFQS